jgi:Protein of unknown function (DUF3037)
MSKIPYSFSVLRYVHDPVTQEFANIGVAVYSRETRYLDAMCTPNYGRIANMFGKIDGYRFRQATRYIQERLRDLGADLSTGLPFDSNKSIEAILATVLPPDDTAFQFSRSGAGISDDLYATLRDTFARFVERYSSHTEPTPRDDHEVWRVYREPLERRHVVERLIPKRIVAPNYDYEFEHAWKNQLWRVYEPVSFDLLEARSILDKANRWVGRATSLADSKEKFKMFILLGEPRESGLKAAFTKAQNILHKMVGDHEFVKESEAEGFADDVAHEIREHGPDDLP